MIARRIAPVTAVLAMLLAAPAGAQTPVPEPTVAPGVTAGGADLSGLTARQASAKLIAEVSPTLGGDVVLGVAGKPWRLTMEDAKFFFDVDGTVKRALAAKTAGSVPLATRHSKLAVQAFVAKIAKQVFRAPRDAKVTLGLRKMHLRRARHGKGLATTAAAKLVDGVLDKGVGERVLHMRLSTLSPAVNANDLRKRYGTIVTVDKSHFKLRLFKQLKLVKTYSVAVGQPAYPTPEGNFSITDKQVNPVWSVPNSPWAGELGGTTVAGGSAANPLKARWMGITDGVGIHGTGDDASIGSAASHGCIRMHVWDVKALYPRVPVGTTVLIRRG
jgi:lipoprotein-anchoring transpeptidase ErfK/SrfK